MKLIATGFIAVVFVMLMCVPGKEGQISFAVENAWAARDPEPGEFPLRFVRFRSSNAPRPMTEPGFLVGRRWHFGLPCRAIYLDSGREDHSGADVWYAKVDLWWATANLLVAIPMGIGTAWLFGIVSRRKKWWASLVCWVVSLA